MNGTTRLGRLRFALLPALALVLTAAAPAPEEADERYVARAGDTPRSIARAYLTDAAAAGEVARLNRLAPGTPLARGRIVLVPTRLLRTEPLNALVTAYRGAVTIDGAPVARVGTLVREGGRIETAAEASVSLGLADGSSVTLPSRSTVRVQRLRRVLLTGRLDRVFLLDTGRSETEVNPKHGAGDRFEIRTPVSVAAVRGTLFRVSADDDGGSATAGVLRGEVRVRRADTAPDGGPSLPRGFGIHSDRESAGTPVPLLPPPDFSPVYFRDDGAQVFTLNPVSGAARYRLQVAADEAFHAILLEQESSAPEIRLPGLADGLYYVRATGIDPNGIEGYPTVHSYRYIKPHG